jgi:hypothetical protein
MDTLPLPIVEFMNVVDNTTRKKFYKLANKWKKQTAYLSNTKYIHKNKNCLELIKMGEKIIPLIFDELKKGDFWWFYLIRLILNDGPKIPLECSGKIDKLTTLYLNWGKERGFTND